MVNLHSVLLQSEWQTLIVLDACRYDIFAKVIGNYNIPGKLIQADSQVQQTSRWYKKHWSGDRIDTVLITGHPQPIKLSRECHFFKAIDIEGDGLEWMYPGQTLAKAVNVLSLYPDKKQLIHLIPPHLPYLTDEGIKFNEVLNNMETVKEKKPSGNRMNATTLYDKATKYGQVNGWAELQKHYRLNLEFALEWVEVFIRDLKGPIVITADHGELLGEANMYAHRGASQILRQVPWYEVAA